MHHLYLYQVYFKFSKEILEVTDITQGTFLSSSGSFETFWVPKWDNSAGEVKVWESLLGMTTASGAGELFKVTFRVKKAGGSKLHLFNNQLFNEFMGTITHDIEDGLFTTAKLSIAPDDVRGSEYTPGVSFDVNVTLDGAVENLYGFNVTITYDAQVLNATSATLIPSLAAPNMNFTEIDFTEGTVWLNVTSTPPAASTNETGPLATITFEILSVGNTDINITKSKLVDTEGEPIIHIVGKASFSGVLRNIGIIGEEVTLSPLEVVAGENITISVKIQNYGGINETFDFTVYATQNNVGAIVAGPTQFSVIGLSNITIPMNLSTNGLEGNYTIRIRTSYVPDETDIGDNEYVYQTLITINPKTAGLVIPWETTAYIAIAIVLVIVAIAVYYKLRRGSKTP